ncbi:MAG: hypothetical protein HY578_09065 [Nitrospinae bacterium]|nr:hypothetical protein [Nitrospinota bacterium]
MKYVCDSCGRLAMSRELLCSPTPLAKPKKAVKKSVLKNVVKSKKRK